MSTHLRVDWTRCRARGVCWELLPEIVQPDDWGYPLGRESGPAIPVPEELHDEARQAVSLCPRLALRLERG